MKILILLLAFLCVGISCDSSQTTTNYGSGVVVSGNDNSNIGNKTPAPVVVPPVVVVE